MKSQDKPLLHLFMHIGHLLEAELRRELALIGVQHGQARVLVNLLQRGSLSQAEIARALSIKPATVTNMLTRMEQASFIERRAHPQHGRKKLTSLTKAGVGAAQKVLAVWQSIESKLFQELENSEREAMRPFLEQVLRNLGGKPPQWTPKQDKNRK
ncbi:MAG: MarR family transcriptional regulator [Planctomycetota bacterium]|nr:MarR family transcriptional regulator [Planctomycetota bacterium]